VAVHGISPELQQQGNAARGLDSHAVAQHAREEIFPASGGGKPLGKQELLERCRAVLLHQVAAMPLEYSVKK